VTTPLAPREAIARILDAVSPQPVLRVPLDDALGSILGAPVESPINIPPWTNSAMDGYAARGADVQGARPEAPIRLRVVGSIAAGQFPAGPIGPGECARIFTGAPLPEGADSVIRQEDTDYGVETVAIRSDRDAGVNIRRTGEDIRRGDQVLQAGDELTPARLGVLASLAVAHPMVHRRPRVAILGSGDEIVDVDQPEEILAGRKIASSNTHTLVALVRLAGGVPVNLGIARDTHESLREHLLRAQDCDLLVTTAGISVGEHDHLRAVLASLGTEMGFWKLRMRPGAPVGFGMVGGVSGVSGVSGDGGGGRQKADGSSDRRVGSLALPSSLTDLTALTDPTDLTVLTGLPWIGLPGNPVSTMVTFELFVRPAIRKMMGHPLPFRRTVPVVLREPVKVGAALQHFLRAVVTPGTDGILEARLTGPQGSGILTSMVRANALLIIPEGQPETAAGATAQALVLDDPRHVASAPF
jgi:molybdopterin molybdotransferase